MDRVPYTIGTVLPPLAHRAASFTTRKYKRPQLDNNVMVKTPRWTEVYTYLLAQQTLIADFLRYMPFGVCLLAQQQDTAFCVLSPFGRILRGARRQALCTIYLQSVDYQIGALFGDYYVLVRQNTQNIIFYLPDTVYSLAEIQDPALNPLTFQRFEVPRTLIQNWLAHVAYMLPLLTTVIDLRRGDSLDPVAVTVSNFFRQLATIIVREKGSNHLHLDMRNMISIITPYMNASVFLNQWLRIIDNLILLEN
jgi:hypothetical protein